MENRGRRTKIVVFLLVLALVFPVVSSVNIGISPATINFEEVMRNGYAERIVVISADSEEPIDIELSPRGEILDWLNFSEWNFSVSRDSPYYLKVSVNPSIDTPNGNYSGFLRVMTSSTGEEIENHAVGKIKSTLDLLINVEVTDIEIIDCSVSDVRVSSVEKGDDIVLSMDVLNKGNVRLYPQVLFNVWDFDQDIILFEDEFFGKEILPTTEEVLEFRIKSGIFDVSQYWSGISVPDCIYNSLLTFDILEEGALSAKGLLLSILTKKEADAGETVPIEVNFKNVGEKEVEAQFKGKVSREGKIIQVLESEESLVSIDDIEKFYFYFTPERSGKYVISGRVYYSGKKTFESSAVLEVIGNNFSIMPVVYVLFIIFIGILFYKIRKERKIYLKKLKYLK